MLEHLRIVTSSSPWTAASAVTALASLADLPAALSEHLESMCEEDWVQGQSSLWYSPEVHPLNWWLGVVGEGALILNEFSRSRFEKLAAAGTVSLHGHHFDFATRILCGGYTQTLVGFPPREPKYPQILGRFECEQGVTYALDHKLLHMVTEPEDGTWSLMLRSPARIRPCHPPSTPRDRDLLCREFERLRGRARQLPSVIPTVLDLSSATRLLQA